MSRNGKIPSRSRYQPRMAFSRSWTRADYWGLPKRFSRFWRRTVIIFLTKPPPNKHAATLYRKIAQADLLMEDDSAAKKALEMAAENLKLAGEPAKNSGTKALGGSHQTKPAPSLPAKLIISAPKKLLDLVAAGKIPYADFRRQANIDYFGFSNLTPPIDNSTN